MLLRLYVGMVTAAAVVASLGIAGSTQQRAPIGAVVAISLLVFLAEFMQLRQLNLRGHGTDFNLVEGILAPLVVYGSGRQIVLVTAAGIGVAELLRHVGPMKALFNTAQWVLASAAGWAVASAVMDGHHTPGYELAATVAAVVVMGLINQFTVGTVLVLAFRTTGHHQTVAQVVGRARTLAVANTLSLVAAVSLAAMYRWSPWLLVLGACFVIGLDNAGRAQAHVRTDVRRLRSLHRATHALATSLQRDHAIPAFLEATLAGFELQAAELVLPTSTGTTTYRCDLERASVTHGDHPLVEPLADVDAPRRLSLSDPGVAPGLLRLGHERVLVAPLRQGESNEGLLLLYDRDGIEGFEDGELAVAAALARELVGFLERDALVSAIDEERRKLADIVDNTSDGILTVQADGTVLSWNDALVAMTGYQAADMVGTRHLPMLRARDEHGQLVLLERWPRALERGSLPQEVQVVTADGHTLWLSCSFSRIPAAEGHREVLVVVARNVTQARELERLKDDFVAVVSHELRTPLAPIKGWAQTLLTRSDRMSEAQQRTAVQQILGQAQKLESLVLNILEASRIESGRSQGDGVTDIVSVAAHVVEDTLAARPDRVVRFTPPSVPCRVRGSAVWVERAVTNLVANAVKYSPDDEAVDITVRVERDEAVLAVTDRGPGIAPESQERVFERFERLEATQKQTGTGLGLYITRRLARAMGGDVEVSSVPGAGSTFLLRLPIAQSPAGVPEQRTSGAAPVVNLV